MLSVIRLSHTDHHAWAIIVTYGAQVYDTHNDHVFHLGRCFIFFFLNIYLSDKPYCFRIYHSNFFFFFNQELLSEDNIFTTLRYRYK